MEWFVRNPWFVHCTVRSKNTWLSITHFSTYLFVKIALWTTVASNHYCRRSLYGFCPTQSVHRRKHNCYSHPIHYRVVLFRQRWIFRFGWRRYQKCGRRQIDGDRVWFRFKWMLLCFLLTFRALYGQRPVLSLRLTYWRVKNIWECLINF